MQKNNSFPLGAPDWLSPAPNIFEQANDGLNQSNSNSAFAYKENYGGLVNWFTGDDPVAHNEALQAWERDEMSAENARQDQWKTRYWEAGREDTQFQRKVADYLAAGFSPLAAMEGSGSYAGNYSASSAQAHSPNGSPRNTGNPGSLITAIVGALAMIASKGMSTSAMAAKTATETAAKAEIAEKAAAAKMAAAETGAQAKVDTARIMKFGDDIKKLGEVDNQSLASAYKTRHREKLLESAGEDVKESIDETAQQYFDRVGKGPSWGFTAKEAREAKDIIGDIPKEWIYNPNKRKK